VPDVAVWHSRDGDALGGYLWPELMLMAVAERGARRSD